MDVNDLHKIADQDTKLSPENVLSKSLELSSLKCKWIKFHSKESLLYKKYSTDYNTLKTKKWEYYRYNFDYVTDNKMCFEVFLPGDNELNTIKLKKDLSKTKIVFIEQTIQTLTNMGFSIKNYIEFSKFQAGE